MSILLSDAPPREVFERSREASGTGRVGVQPVSIPLSDAPPREVFERSREASGAGRREAQHETMEPRRSCTLITVRETHGRQGTISR